MDTDGNLYVGEHEIYEFHHSTFMGGQAVGGAGEITVKNGKVVRFSDKSGYYHPGKVQTEQTMDVLRSKGVDVENIDELAVGKYW